MIFLVWMIIVASIFLGSIVLWSYDNTPSYVAYIAGFVIGFGVAIAIGYIFEIFV